ncbi:MULTISPECIES: dTMP kinase [Pelosinus]|uniref:Thymidylate kinase n=1 Tax=Pelosinus fermentans B4 TaxID=1149862 RepID=I9L684_9FIRM|nr:MULTISPECIES: thymidylate kinase [Pelosinus]EIW15859.1 Thymidylate kinase [Pelosinus fermentans B4]EIW27435.1 thymidylate kinase [Pelosinus fermentans A11]
MNGKLIIIEAGDGSGKATQTEKLYHRLKEEKRTVRKVSFPDYKSSSSALIKMYLNGDFGNRPDSVNPYAASSFYAVDRYASYKQDWGDFYKQGGIIIADRYTTSNMVHQAVKIHVQEEKDAFLDWLWDLEFVKFGLPIPDGVIFLDMPPMYSKILREERAKNNGEQTPDIHERDEQYLENCYSNYCAIADKYHWHKISCIHHTQLKTVDEIHEDVYQSVQNILARNK